MTTVSKRKTKAQKRMEGAVAYLQEYMQTYSNQHEYQNYLDATFIDDVLYGLGVALGGNRGASGYAEFKDALRKHLAL